MGNLAQITFFNIKRDIADHQAAYVLTALIAVAGIVFSTQMFRITALQGVNHRIVLGGSLAILGIETLILMKRNVTYHYRVEYSDFKKIMKIGNHCAIINASGNRIYIERYDPEARQGEMGGEFSNELTVFGSNHWQPVKHQAMIVLGKTNQEIEKFVDDGEFTEELQSRMKEDEYCNYKGKFYTLNGETGTVPQGLIPVLLYILMGRSLNDYPKTNKP